MDSLRSAILDGLGWSVMVGAGEAYLGAFGVFLLASPLQLGILGAVPSLAVAASQGVGLWLMKRGRRNVCWTAASAHALLWVPLIAVAVLGAYESQTIGALMLMVCCLFFAGGLGAPAWNSLIGDLVPERKRGRYFGFRSKRCGLATFLALLAAGQILHICEALGRVRLGFALIFSVAGLARLFSAYWLSRYADPGLRAADTAGPTLGALGDDCRTQQFRLYTVLIGLINLGANIAAPYFALYMLRGLRFSYFEFTFTIAVHVAFQYLSLQHWGILADRFGSRRVLVLCSLGVACSPLPWLWSDSIWQLLPVQICSGFVWAGFNLAMSNYLFEALPREERGRAAAFQGMVNGVCVFIGALVGGVLASNPPEFLDYIPIWSGPSGVLLFLFTFSGFFRLLCAVSILPSLRDLREVEPISWGRFLRMSVQIQPLRETQRSLHAVLMEQMEPPVRAS